MPPRQAAVKQRRFAVLEGSEDQRGRDRGANRVEQLALTQPLPLIAAPTTARGLNAALRSACALALAPVDARKVFACVW